jgi:hypothetical protein
MARTNLAIRPSVKNSATNWFGPGDWARTASAHSSLPRTTAFAGTTPGDLQMDRGAVTAGKWYVWSASVRFTSPQVFETATHWYASGNVYISQTDGNEINRAGSTTARVVSGVGQPPAGAVDVRPVILGVDGAAEVTAVLIQEYDSEAEALAALDAHATAAYYFDGDGNGIGETGAAYAWTGTDGASTSTTTAGLPATGSATFADFTAVGIGKRRRKGSAAATFESFAAATGLIATAAYDDRRGRVRVNALGMADSVVRVLVDSRQLGTSRWRPVRGGKVSAVDNRFARPVDDYEYRGGAVMQYRITALSSSENSPDVVVHSKILTVDDIPDVTWLKFIAAPYLNRRLILTGWSPVSRKSKNATFQVRGRIGPVAVTDVHDAREMTIRVATRTVADRDALDNALAQGAPVLFQTPDNIACPTMYAVVGDYEWRTVTKILRDGRPATSEFTIPLTEVSAPPPSIVGAGITWAVLAQNFASWSEVLDEHPTWQELTS